MNLTKRARQETGVSKVFPITHLNSPGVFETKEGFVGATLALEGVAFEMKETSYLNQMNHRLHQALLHLDERFIAYVTLHRHKEVIALNGEFKSSFARQVNEKYHARFKNQSLYRNNLYLTLILKGDDTSKLSRSLSFLEKLKAKKHIENKSALREEYIKVLLNKVSQLKTSLSAFKPHVLGEKDLELGYSELLHFLSLIPNGGETFSQPPKPTPFWQTPYPIHKRRTAIP